MDKKKKILIACGCAAGVIAAAYGIGAYYYSTHFLPNSEVNTFDVSGMTTTEAKTLLTTPSAEVISIVERNDVQESVSLSDISYEISLDDEELETLLTKQNAFSWPAALFQKQELDLTLETTYNSDSLAQSITNLTALQADNMTAPTDAKIALNAENVYEIIAEDLGTTLVYETVLQTVTDSINSEIFTINLDECGCYTNPAVLSTDESLTNALQILQSLNNEVISVDLQGGVVVTMEPMELAGLFTLNEDGTTAVNETALQEYVYALADTYNTYETARTFTTTYGSVISVGGSGKDTYGYWMNEETTIDSIRTAITSGTTQTAATYWDVSANTRNAENCDIGSTYIEISIDSQKLWFYLNGELYMTADVITGLPQHNQDTPTGLFRIWSKQTNRNLKGTAWDGSTWDSFVNFWMPITWTGVGLHDASWQSAFGGSLYKTKGSHGCINLSYSVASTIYYNAPLNTPVIIY